MYNLQVNEVHKNFHIVYYGNNLRHQLANMHIVTTVSFVRIYAKPTKDAKCSEKVTLCTKHVYFSTVFFFSRTSKVHKHSRYCKYFDQICTSYN